MWGGLFRDISLVSWIVTRDSHLTSYTIPCPLLWKQGVNYWTHQGINSLTSRKSHLQQASFLGWFLQIRTLVSGQIQILFLYKVWPFVYLSFLPLCSLLPLISLSSVSFLVFLFVCPPPPAAPGPPPPPPATPASERKGERRKKNGQRRNRKRTMIGQSESGTQGVIKVSPQRGQ